MAGEFRLLPNGTFLMDPSTGGFGVHNDCCATCPPCSVCDIEQLAITVLSSGGAGACTIDMDMDWDSFDDGFCRWLWEEDVGAHRYRVAILYSAGLDAWTAHVTNWAVVLYGSDPDVQGLGCDFEGNLEGSFVLAGAAACPGETCTITLNGAA